MISTGLIAGVSACLFLFGSIHILALVFGCSLVGVAVDYAIHYFCAQYASEKYHPLSTLKSLIPALPLGVLSSALGYGILVILPFPGIQQMAVLASVGLLSSFITVVLFGPYIVRNRNLTPPLPTEYIQKGLMNFAALGGVRSVKLILSVLFLSFAGLGIMNIRFEDDVRQFQSLDQDLKQQENRIKSMFKMDSSPKFIAITMPTLEKALQLEEKILDKLMGLKGEKASFRGLSQLTPSQKRQEENQILIQEKLFNPHLKTLTQALGATLPSHKTKTDVFSLKTSESDTLPTGWRGLISHTEAGKTTLRLMINGDINPEAVEAIVSSHENALYVDPAREYSNIFKTYRNIMLYVLLSVLGLVAFILALKETPSIAFKALIPVVIALSTTLGLLGILGVSVNLFHVMGLMLVLCIGIDYALFLCLHKGSHKETYLLLANGMAALTTLLSFGLLSFSSTNAVHSFGLSVFMGIILCFVLQPYS